MIESHERRLGIGGWRLRCRNVAHVLRHRICCFGHRVKGLGIEASLICGTHENVRLHIVWLEMGDVAENIVEFVFGIVKLTAESLSLTHVVKIRVFALVHAIQELGGSGHYTASRIGLGHFPPADLPIDAIIVQRAQSVAGASYPTSVREVGLEM